MDEPDANSGEIQPTSRLCVKNLPKNVNEAKLREQFSKFGEVTDAKVMRTADGQSRQMAFVGFKTVEQASTSQKYFDRSFMGSVRLQVAFAAQVGNSTLPRPWSKYSQGSSANRKKKVEESKEEPAEEKKKAKKAKKQKEPAEEEVDPKLAEFLALMQPRVKARVWSNDEFGVPQKAQQAQQAAAASKGQGKGTALKPAESDDEHGEEDALYQDLPHLAEGEEAMEDDAAPAPKDCVVVDAGVSDLDYLKSRMRTLDSDEEEEEQEDKDDDEDDSDDSMGDDEDEDEEEDDDDDDDDDPDSPKNNAALRGDQSGVGARPNTKGEKQGEEEDGDKAEVEEEEEDGGAGGAGGPVTVEGEKSIAETGRLFVRNLPYTATEGELMELFQKYGELQEVHLVMDRSTKRSKGFAYVSFVQSDDAVSAAAELDCSIFQGRLLHILPASRPPAKDKQQAKEQEGEEGERKGTSFKAEREANRKAGAGSRSAWNTLFMRQDTVAEAIAAHYGVAKSQLLDRDAGDLAVRMALGEAHVISQTKAALADGGVDVGKLEAAAAASGKASATKSVSRSDTTLLVKNLPYSTTEEDLEDMFGRCGGIARLVVPPTRTLALVEFLEAQDARKAFKSLAYKKYQHVPLYLEWAPRDIFTTPAPPAKEGQKIQGDTGATAGDKKTKRSTAADNQAAAAAAAPLDGDADEEGAGCSLYVKNLAFATNAARLRTHFDAAISSVGGRLVSCKLMMHKGPDGKDLSRGFGFVEVDSEEVARTVLKQMQGSMLDGHQLRLQLSRRKASTGPTDDPGKASAASKKSKGAKDAESTTLVVRNLAFEATHKDVTGLFSPFGHIKACRLPKKMDGSIRGFAFVEFVTKQEAKQAMEGVMGTHLYGRRLVVEYAKEESSLDELRAKTAAKFKGELI